MQKIILSDKTLAIIVQRLKHFYNGVVEESFFINDSSLIDILRKTPSYRPTICYAGEVTVERWEATRDGSHPAGYAINTGLGWVYPGRVFYFLGNRTIIVMGEPREYKGDDTVKLTLVSSRKRMTDDQMNESMAEYYSRRSEEAFEEYREEQRQQETDLMLEELRQDLREDQRDQQRMDEAADRVMEESHRY